MVLWDPGRNILAKTTFSKSDAEWIYQLTHAASVLDRLAALRRSRRPEQAIACRSGSGRVVRAQGARRRCARSRGERTWRWYPLAAVRQRARRRVARSKRARPSRRCRCARQISVELKHAEDPAAARRDRSLVQHDRRRDSNAREVARSGHRSRPRNGARRTFEQRSDRVGCIERLRDGRRKSGDTTRTALRPLRRSARLAGRRDRGARTCRERAIRASPRFSRACWAIRTLSQTSRFCAH